MPEPIAYRIFPTDPAAHLFEVRVTVAEPHPEGQVFAIPAWIPGSYMIRDYAKHVVSAMSLSRKSTRAAGARRQAIAS